MERNNTLIQYCATITFLLAVSYILIITNPPPALENMAVPEDVSAGILQEHGEYILVFWAFLPYYLF